MSEKVLEIVGQAACIVLAWYLTEPHPEVVPAFWYHVGRLAHRVGEYSNRQYAIAIKGYL